MNVWVEGDHEQITINICIDFPGSYHDVYILSNMSLHHLFEDKVIAAGSWNTG